MACKQIFTSTADSSTFFFSEDSPNLGSRSSGVSCRDRSNRANKNRLICTIARALASGHNNCRSALAYLMDPISGRPSIVTPADRPAAKMLARLFTSRSQISLTLISGYLSTTCQTKEKYLLQMLASPKLIKTDHHWCSHKISSRAPATTTKC